MTASCNAVAFPDDFPMPWLCTRNYAYAGPHQAIGRDGRVHHEWSDEVENW